MKDMKMKSFLFVCVVCLLGGVYSQTVRSATLLDHRAYTIEVISKTMQAVEELQWCNLKIPEFTKNVTYSFFGRDYTGTVTYSNGFVVSVQRVDLLESSVQQVWTWWSAGQYGTVDVRSQLRVQDLVLGFDVDAELNGERHRYTATFKHPMITFNFSILKNMETNEITITVVGADPRSSGRAVYLPNDEYSDILGTSFDQADTVPGILAWGTDIFQPFCQDVVMNRVPFPKTCYNC